MKRPACFLLFLLLAAPAFAQTGQQFGILFGGAKRLYSGRDKDKFPGLDTGRTSSWIHGVREIFYAVQVEPSTMFKIQAGQWNTDVGAVQSDAPAPHSGHVEHVDGIVDYRFTEPFGTTGLFGGLGLYRWNASPPGSTATTETNYGYVVGVNGEFPMTKRYAVMVEGAYHWVNMSSPVRYVTLTGGLRIGF